MLLTGLMQAFAVVAFSVIFNIMVRFGTVEYNIEAIVFACVSTVSASLMLSIFAGPGRLVNDTLKTPTTWFYGISAIGVFILDVYLSKYVTATEMSLFGRMAIPISLFVSIVVFKRSKMKSDLLGLVFVMIGLGLLFYIQDISVLWIVFVLALASGLVSAGEVIFAEVHSQSQKANESGNMRDKARVVGFVSFTTSMMFLVVVFAGSLMREFVMPNVEALAFLPALERFTHAPSVWFGLFYGLLMASTGRYFFWSASYKLKSDNILALLAFVPLLTFATEWILSHTGLFAANESMFAGDRGHMLLIACALLTFGSGLSVFMRVRNEIKKERTGHFMNDIKRALAIDSADVSSIQHVGNAMDDYEVITATLAHVEGDMQQAATLLNIPHDTLHVINESRGTAALVGRASQDMARRYRTHVASRDALTGLYNRSAFMGKVKSAITANKKASVLFVDLDKFKPVNDTYGHEAGDNILKGIAKRLTAALPKGSVVTRLGGDEFCVLVTEIAHADVEKLATLVKNEVSEPFDLKGIDVPVSVGASIGIGSYPKDAQTAEELVAFADKGMYGAKKSR